MSSEDRNSEWSGLLRQSLKGDSAAYQRFLASVTGYLRKAVGRKLYGNSASIGDAEDIVQDIVLTIHLKRHTWDPERPVLPWIAVIARNKLIDALRRRGRRAEVAIDDLTVDLEAEDSGEASSRGDLEAMLKTLPEKQRAIIEASAIEGRSSRELAESLGMSEVAVRVALHRALKALSNKFRDTGS